MKGAMASFVYYLCLGHSIVPCTFGRPLKSPTITSSLVVWHGSLQTLTSAVDIDRNYYPTEEKDDDRRSLNKILCEKGIKLHVDQQI